MRAAATTPRQRRLASKLASLPILSPFRGEGPSFKRPRRSDPAGSFDESSLRLILRRQAATSPILEAAIYSHGATMSVKGRVWNFAVISACTVERPHSAGADVRRLLIDVAGADEIAVV